MGKKIHQKDIYNFFISLKFPLGYYIPKVKDENLKIYDKNFNLEYFKNNLSFD